MLNGINCNYLVHWLFIAILCFRFTLYYGGIVVSGRKNDDNYDAPAHQGFGVKRCSGWYAHYASSNNGLLLRMEPLYMTVMTATAAAYCLKYIKK